MHTEETAAQVRLHHQQGLSFRKIAKLLGVARATVSEMVNLPWVARTPACRVKKKSQRVVWGKCSSCGNETRLPCLACSLRNRPTKRRDFDEVEHLGIDLQGDDLVRFEEVRNRQPFTPVLGQMPRASCEEVVDTSCLPLDLMTEVTLEVASLL